jgi:ubiquinone/menaquinone biosynthesis C-methylase UbiE
MPSDVSERQKRETEYYDNFYSKKDNLGEVPPLETVLHPISGRETRPHNMSWHAIEVVAKLGLTGKKLLEIGCGTGEFLPIWVHLGADVYAMDISSVAVETARERCARYGMESRVTLKAMTAERLDYPDNFFDVVYGYGILHHVNVEEAARELSRVMKPGATGVFIEWIAWPFFEKIRNTKLVLTVLPHDGFRRENRECTDDERKLGAEDERVLRAVFPTVEYRKFYFLTRLGPFMKCLDPTLQKLDHRLFRFFPVLRNWAAGAVIVVRK